MKTRWKISEEWEHNGRDDSDWYCVVYDSEKDKVYSVEVGTTRFAGCSKHHSQVCYECAGINTGELPPDVKEKATEALRKVWVSRLTTGETNRVMFARKEGDVVVLKENVHNRPREKYEVDCWKCNGTGYWQNPRRESDKRSCFGCNGTGKRTKSRAGKGKSITIKKGDGGTIVNVLERRSQYGTWSYSTTAIVRREDGSTFRAPLEKLRLNEEIDTAAIERIAAERAKIDAYTPFRTASISGVSLHNRI